MPEEPITFEFIRKIQREEKTEPRLSKIPEDFYDKAKAYLKEKKKLSGKKKDRIASLEVKNAEMLLEDIYNRRETKIMDQAIITTRTDIPPKNLLKQEKEFFESLVNTLRSQRGMVLNTLLKKDKEEKLETVKFMDDIPEFVGIDLKKYGPFKKEEKAKIPKENAELLKKTGKAKSVKR